MPTMTPAEQALLDRLERVRQLRAAAAKEDARIRALPVRGPKVVEIRDRKLLVESTAGGTKEITLTRPINVHECWLRWAWYRRWVTQRQHDAGMELRNYHERSMLHTERAADYTLERVDGGGHNDAVTVDRLHAAHQYGEAIRALNEADYPSGNIARYVVVEDRSASQLEDIFRWRHGTGLGHIRVVLDMLGEWWWGEER